MNVLLKPECQTGFSSSGVGAGADPGVSETPAALIRQLRHQAEAHDEDKE